MKSNPVENVGIAIIGCGRVASRHIEAIATVSGAKLLSVCDLDVRKCNDYGLRFDVPSFTSYHEMLSSVPGIDLVSIITPSGLHATHALDILENYEKHLAVEKPTFLRVRDLHDVYERADSVGKLVFPIFQNRYNPAVKRVKSAIDNGELGEPRVAAVRVRWCRPQRYYDQATWRGTFSLDGGALSNQGIHLIDILQYMLGRVEAVSSLTATQGVEVEVENTAVAILRHESGCLSSIEITTAAYPDDIEASFSIIGSRGMAQIGGVALNQLQSFTPAPHECETHSQIVCNGYGFGHDDFYENVVSCLRHGITAPIERQECAHIINILHGIYVSSRDGKFVTPSEDVVFRELGAKDVELWSAYCAIENR